MTRFSVARSAALVAFMACSASPLRCSWLRRQANRGCRISRASRSCCLQS